MKQSRSLFKSAGCLLALTSLLINSSCSQEEIAMTLEEGSARFSITLPGEFGTRASFGDGTKASVNTLYWTLYEIDTKTIGGGVTHCKPIVSDIIEDAFEVGEGTSQNVSMPLVVGKKYLIAFCAMNSGNNLVSYNDGILEMHYENASCNSADDDVFTAVSETIDMTSGAGYSKNIILSRPLAQVNWGSTDFDEDAVAAHINEARATVTYTSGLYTKLDLVNGIVSEPVEKSVSFPAISCKNLPKEDFPVPGDVAKLVAMNYVLVGTEESAAINCEISFKGGFNTKVEVNSAPVQANWRTNIYGGLITNSGEIYVVMDKEFETQSISERYLTPETKKVVDALKDGKLEIVIPAEESIDLTGLGTFYLNDGQKITLEGTLILDSEQLILNGENGITPEVTFKGNGRIYTKYANPVLICQGAKGIFEGISIIWDNPAATAGTALKSEGEINLHSVDISSPQHGIVINSGGKLTASECKIISCCSFAHSIKIYSNVNANLEKCHLISQYITLRVIGDDANVTASECTIESSPDGYNAIEITSKAIAKLEKCHVVSDKLSALSVKNSEVNVVGGSYESNSDTDGKNTMEITESSIANISDCHVLARNGSAVKVGESSNVTIHSGRYEALGHFVAVRLDYNSPNLTILGGEFIAVNNRGSIERVNNGEYTGHVISLQGGKFSGAYTDSYIYQSLPVDPGYKVIDIDETTPEGFKLKYEIVAK